MIVRSGKTEQNLELFRENFKANLGTPSLYVGTFMLMILVSYSGSFHTDKMGPFPVRLQFFFALAVILFTSFHVWSAIIAVLVKKVVLGNIALELLASVPVAITGIFITPPLVLNFSLSGRVYSSASEIIANYFIFVPMFIVGFSYHMRKSSFRFMKRELEPEVSSDKVNVKNPPDDSNLAASAPKPAANTPVYLEADDHTLKLVFENRVVLKRTKLSNEMLKWSSEGLQVHKSFWVNISHIAGRERLGRQMILILKTGERIPVGRSFEKVVAALDI